MTTGPVKWVVIGTAALVGWWYLATQNRSAAWRQGYNDATTHSPKASTDPEYLTGYEEGMRHG